MHLEKKEAYVQPMLVKHELLRDITASVSGQITYSNQDNQGNQNNQN